MEIDLNYCQLNCIEVKLTFIEIKTTSLITYRSIFRLMHQFTASYYLPVYLIFLNMATSLSNEFINREI